MQLAFRAQTSTKTVTATPASKAMRTTLSLSWAVLTADMYCSVTVKDCTGDIPEEGELPVSTLRSANADATALYGENQSITISFTQGNGIVNRNQFYTISQSTNLVTSMSAVVTSSECASPVHCTRAPSMIASAASAAAFRAFSSTLETCQSFQYKVPQWHSRQSKMHTASTAIEGASSVVAAGIRCKCWIQIYI